MRAVNNGAQKGGNAMKKEIPEATNIGGIRILTVRDVAEILNISIGKAHQLFDSSSFPSTRLGRKKFILEPLFYRWLEENAGRAINI